jgi:hypothetical protein
MRSLGNANYWHKVTQGFPPECPNCPTPSHCRSEPEGTAGYCRTAEGPVARTVTFNLAIRKSSVLSRRLTGHPFSNIAAQSSLSAFSRMSRRDRALARSSVLRDGARTERDYRFRQASFGANLSTAARQTSSFLRAAVAISSTTCFGDFQPAKTIGFYDPRFSELRYTP